MWSNGRTVKTFGFTLIELLVIVVIISLLAALLFPVFVQAKEAAKKTACLSNVKQLNLGMILYTGDFDEVLPPLAYPSNSPIWADLVQPYIKSSQLRVCGDDQNSSISYGLNQLVFFDLYGWSGPVPPFHTMEDFAFPSETVMMSELGTQDDLKTPVYNSLKVVVPDDDINDVYDARPSFRHFSKDNLAMFDGHAKAFLKEQFYVGWTPADYWFCTDRNNVESCSTTN